ncbi:hypothetical protein [Peribacillus butanolivorans]
MVDILNMPIEDWTNGIFWVLLGIPFSTTVGYIMDYLGWKKRIVLLIQWLPIIFVGSLWILVNIAKLTWALIIMFW